MCATFSTRSSRNSVDGRSVARKLSALRHFYKYLLLDRYIAARSHAQHRHARGNGRCCPSRWRADEVESVLQGPPRAKDDRVSQALAARDRAMLEVFYAGALRVSEIVNLKLEDLKLELGYVLVRGKGDKERIVPLGRPAQEMLQSYLRDARPVLAAGKRSPLPVHRARSARPITRQRVWQMVSAASAQSGATPARTCCATVAPRTWWRTAPTCARCRPSSGTPTSRLRRCTRTWRSTG